MSNQQPTFKILYILGMVQRLTREGVQSEQIGSGEASLHE